MASKTKVPRFSLNTAEYYREFFATGALGGMNPNKCTITFYDDKPVLTIPDGARNKVKIDEVNREIQASVYMTPVQFKQMAQWMMKTVQHYEKRFGKIELSKSVKESTQPNFIS
jgi:hypothetical protein